MPSYAGDTSTFFVKKLGGVALLILGLLLTAVGFTYPSNAVTILGVVLLALGAGLLAFKIARRNRA